MKHMMRNQSLLSFFRSKMDHSKAGRRKVSVHFAKILQCNKFMFAGLSKRECRHVDVGKRKTRQNCFYRVLIIRVKSD